MNNLEQFASRGLKAQAAVDKQLAAHAVTPALPASSPAAGSSPGSSAGEANRTPPRSPAQTATDSLADIAGSHDLTQLRGVLADPDRNLAERSAADRRLRILRRESTAETQRRGGKR